MNTQISSQTLALLKQRADAKHISLDDYLVFLMDLEGIVEKDGDIFERMTDAFFGLDNSWRFIYMNSEAESLLGRSRDSLMYKNIWDEFPEAIDTAFYREYHFAVEHQQPVVFVEWYEPLELWFEVHAYPSEKGLSVYFRDVTLRKKLELALQNSLFELDMRVKERTIALEKTNELLQNEIIARKKAEEDLHHALNAERELGQLRSYIVSMVSHEFRTPLATIRAATDLLKNYHHRLTDMHRIHHLEKIQGQVTHLTTLLETTLLIAKSQSNRLSLYFEYIDFQEFIQRLVQDIQYFAGEKPRLILQIEGDYSRYHFDKQLTTILLSNLITNAIKYSPKGGDIGVYVICEQNWIRIRIQDSGIGIPPDDLTKLFDEFYRARNVGAISGTGLGLTLAKNIVDLYGGKITLDSVLNVGTIVSLELPVCSSDDDGATINDI